jgi:diguanylate cyclase (GGDEF)-like protein
MLRRPGTSKFVLTALLMLFVYGAQAQRFTFKAYRQLEGLVNLNINCMLQDRAGFLWLGTDNGLSRYDGARFATFGKADGLTSPYVLALSQDSTGHLWVGTSGGLFHLEHDRFTEVTFNGSSLPIDVDSSLAALDDGRILAVSNYHLIEIAPQPGHTWRIQPLGETGAFRSLPRTTLVTSILSARDQALWFGCGKSLCQAVDGKVKVWGESLGVPSDDWTTLYQSRDHGIWARSVSRVFFLPAGANHFENRGSPGRLTNNYYVSFAEDLQGRILTPAADGLAIWENGQWHFYGSEQGLSSYPVMSVLVDSTGQIWMGVGGHGLLRWLGYREWEHWTIADGLQSPIVWSVLRDRRGSIWVGDDRGLSVKSASDTRFHPVGQSLGDAALSIFGLAEDRDGGIWACSGTGLVFRVDPVTLAIRRYSGIPATHQIYADSHNQIWISTEQGIYAIDDARTSIHAHKSGTGPINSSDVYRIIEDKSGTLWAATLSGLFYEQQGDWKPALSSAHGFVNRLSDIDTASDRSLWTVPDFANPWHLGIDRNRIASAESFESPGSASIHALFARVDARGRLWVGQDHGIDVFDGHSWRLYSAADGLLWNDINAKAFFPDPDGSIWIGTSEGLSHLLYAGGRTTEQRSVPPLSAHLISIRYGNTELDPATQPILRWNQSPLEINLAPLRFLHENAISYLYRLSGVDPEWIATSDSNLRFTPLPPGNYTFQVIAVDNAWREKSPVTTFSFTIRPPWWESWPFRAILALLFAGLALLGWQLRVRRLVGHQQHLEFLVTERTRELQQEKAELIRTREALRVQATRDSLTGLWNRGAIVEILERELKRAVRERSLLSIILIDLDYFKEINDGYGHLTGDAVLREFSVRLQAAVRPYDFAGRYGGEEFLLVLPLQSMDTAEQRLRTLHAQLSGISIRALDIELQITCSLGVAFVQNGESHALDQILSTADNALYRAKARGRNCIEFA